MTGIQDAAYQVNLALQALGTGGIFGKGWLNGPLTNNADIPVLWADFPFAAVGEQFGLVGCAPCCSACTGSPWCASGASPTCRATASAPTSAPACSPCSSGRSSRTSA